MSGIDAFLALFPRFSAITGSLRLKRYSSGEFVVREGQHLNRLAFILSGTARVYRNLYNGRTHLFQVYRPGEVVGDIEYFLEIPAGCSVEAGGTLEVAEIPHAAISPDSVEHARMVKQLAAGLARKLHRESSQAALNSSYSLRMRLAAYLSAGNGLASGRFADAANMLGTSDRHLRRTLAELTSEGYLRRSSGAYLIRDPQALRELCGDLLSP